MPGQTNSGWKNWGDHPIIVFISVGTAILGVTLTIVGLLNIKNNDESARPVILSPAPAVNQQQQQQQDEQQKMPAPQPTLPSMKAKTKPRSPSGIEEKELTAEPPGNPNAANKAAHKIMPRFGASSPTPRAADNRK